MVRQLVIGAYCIEVYNKEDGDALHPDHFCHRQYCSVQQVHQPIMHSISEGDHCGLNLWKADALVSQSRGIGVYVADCLPVAILGSDYFAVVHCSRRTLYTGLLHQVLDSFQQRGELIRSIRMGPCIKQYEVGSEFVDYFPAPFLTPFGEKYLLDLIGYASSVCNYFGISEEHIIIDPSCTLRDETYRSRRRGEQGRNFVGVRTLR